MWSQDGCGLDFPPAALFLVRLASVPDWDRATVSLRPAGNCPGAGEKEKGKSSFSLAQIYKQNQKKSYL
jgi:hypothetical protein